MQINYFDLSALLISLSCLPLLFLAELPTIGCWYLFAALLVMLAFAYVVFLNPLILSLAILMIGFLWSTAYAKQYLTNISPYIDQDLQVSALVTSVNTDYGQQATKTDNHYIQFEFVKSSNLQPLPISVYWDREDKPQAGQRWQLTLKTQITQSYLNEGGFDSQRYAIANKRLLTAKVRHATLIENNTNFKQSIINQITPTIEHFAYQDIMLALAFGDRTHLSRQHRILMRETGTAHLMAISGMHIILVYLISVFIGKAAQFLLPIRLMHYAMPIALGLICSAFYAWLSGLNPPAIRALLALSIWVILRYRHSQLSAWQKVNRIIAMLLIIDPLMMLSESFWLSCYAVICLIFMSDWIALPEFMLRKKRWYLVRLLHLQFVLSLLLLPIQLLVFQGISVSSLMANLIAIPIITLLTFPAILMALIFSVLTMFHCSILFWCIAEQSIEWLFDLLSWLNGEWYDIPASYYSLSLVGWLSIIIWRTGYWRRFAITLLALLLILVSPSVKQKNYLWKVDMLDVGHGLAVVIHNGRHAILYDTGVSWEGSTAAERVILPFLKYHNLHLDGIIISHEHVDHVGGLDVMQQHYPSAWLMSSSRNLANNINCLVGNVIHWQQLTLKVLWPKQLSNYAQNPDSCVIRVSDGNFSILLTGDLEKQQEYQLVETYYQQLASTFLQIPHHGSKTSSSYPFLHYVSPTMSLASAARYNPWRLPSKQVLSKYSELTLPYYVTATSGQISLFFSKDHWQVKTMREKIKPRWYHDWLGSLPDY